MHTVPREDDRVCELCETVYHLHVHAFLVKTKLIVIVSTHRVGVKQALCAIMSNCCRTGGAQAVFHRRLIVAIKQSTCCRFYIGKINTLVSSY